MARSKPTIPAPRSAADLADAADLRSVISAALTETPIDDDMLRRGVWTFVGVERDAGASPGQVIIDLTDLLNSAQIKPLPVHEARLRQMILWCVEAYFGHLGGDVAGRHSADPAGAPVPSPAVSDVSSRESHQEPR
jgi:hypothetical protein